MQESHKENIFSYGVILTSSVSHYWQVDK